MLLINGTNTNAYFNLAMEEYFLKNAKEDIFLLWRNENAIIVGKNQNTLSEIKKSGYAAMYCVAHPPYVKSACL